MDKETRSALEYLAQTILLVYDGQHLDKCERQKLSYMADKDRPYSLEEAESRYKCLQDKMCQHTNSNPNNPREILHQYMQYIPHPWHCLFTDEITILLEKYRELAKRNP